MVSNSGGELVCKSVPSASVLWMNVCDRCRDNDVLFDAPRIGLLPSRFFFLLANKRQKEMAAQQNLCVVQLKTKDTNDVLEVSALFSTPRSDRKILDRVLKRLKNCPAIAVIVPVKTSFLLGQRSSSAKSCTPSEGGALDQAKDVDVWVSCSVLQLWSEKIPLTHELRLLSLKLDDRMAHLPLRGAAAVALHGLADSCRHHVHVLFCQGPAEVLVSFSEQEAPLPFGK